MTVDVRAGRQIKRLFPEPEYKDQWTLPSVGFITEQTIPGANSQSLCHCNPTPLLVSSLAFPRSGSGMRKLTKTDDLAATFFSQ
jgi:hypothetical protein